MFLFLLTTILLLIGFLIRRNIKKSLQFWKDKKVPHVEPWLILGNMAPTVFGRKAFPNLLVEYYQRYYNERYYGFYQFLNPVLMVKDIDLIKQICIKDFEHFPDHSDFLPRESDPFWKNGLFGRDGKQWHDMRTILSPAFTSGKLKAMFHLMTECAQEFTNYLEQQKENVLYLDMHDAITKLTNDVIASTALGVKCNSFKQQDNEFYVIGREAFDFSRIKGIKFFGSSISPKLMKMLKVTMFGEKVTNFFRRIVKETIAYREKTGLVRPDMIHLLRQAQKGTLESDAESQTVNTGNFGNDSVKKAIITDEDITAQAVIFLFGGYDTVAALMCNVAYELALNSNVQDKLIKEIDDALATSNGKITYDALIGMKYLDMVISEILRLWAPGVFLNRACVKDYTIEPKLPGEKPLHIERGTYIAIPTFAIHRDSQYFPNPNKFDPERFNDENKNAIPPYTYIPFGLGPRLCIGNRFALLSIKIGLFYLLAQFKIVPSEKTSTQSVVDKNSIVPKQEGGYWLGLKRRQ